MSAAIIINSHMQKDDAAHPCMSAVIIINSHMQKDDAAHPCLLPLL